MITLVLSLSMRVRKAFSAAVLLLTVCTYLLLGIIFTSFFRSSAQVAALQQTTRPLCKITDDFIAEDERAFFSRADSLDCLRKLYAWQTTTDAFLYFSAGRQPIDIQRLTSSDPLSNKPGVVDCQSIQVSDGFFRYFQSVRVANGIPFDAGAYEYDFTGSTPILLGSSYAGSFAIGDRCTVNYIGEQLTCTVTGFLAEGSYYSTGEQLIFLDHCAVLPALRVVPDSIHTAEQKKFAMRVALDNCCGYAAADASAVHAQLVQQCLALNVKPLLVEGIPNYYPAMWGLEGAQLRGMMLAFTVVMLVSLALCNALNMATKIRYLRRYYAIFIANGLSQRAVCAGVVCEILLTNLFGFLFGALTVHILFGTAPYAALALTAAGTTVLSSVYPLLRLKQLRLSKILRGEE